MNHHLIRFVATLIIVLSFTVAGCGGGGDDDNAAGSASAPTPSAAKTLAIAPIAQQSPVWCWAASAQMVFTYYGLPSLSNGNNYQCGIVAAYWGNAYPACVFDCTLCQAGIGGMSDMQVLIDQYGIVARSIFGVPSRVLGSRIIFNALTMQQVTAEIDAGRPVVAGISPNGYRYPNISQHVVVIVGYDTTNASNPRVIVNDPFPYEAFPTSPNPYLAVQAVHTRPGQYAVSYGAFVNPINWANTLYGIQ